MSELGVAILGCGVHGARYLRHLQRGDVPGMRVRCIQRRDEEAGQRLAREHGVDYVADTSAALARSDIDAVVIASPPGAHLAQIRQALAVSKPILCEKPLGRGIEDVEGLLEFARAPVVVAQTLRYQPTLVELRRRRDDWGRVHRQRWCQRLEPSPLQWQRQQDSAGGGSVILTGVHLFDQIRWWWGRTPDSVVAEMLSVQGHPFENLFTATFGFEPEQRLVSAEVTKCAPTRCGWVETVGERGQVWADYMRGLGQEIVGTDTRSLELPADHPSLPGILQDFACFVRGEIDNPISIVDGIETLRMAEACYRSYREGRRVHLGEISPTVR